MSQKKLDILWIDSRRDDIRVKLGNLRKKLSPRGDIVSPAGRRKTIETFGEPLSPQEVVHRILEEVRKKGLPALLDYSARIDGAKLTGPELRVPREELEKARQAADPDYLATIRHIKENIEIYQRSILRHGSRIERPGGWLAERCLPLRRIGICVPGGAAAYPSTVLMTAVPALVAGVKEIAMMAPPTPNGSYNPLLLATCREIGVTEIYRMGGAQGVAALAYGVEGIERVDKIVGPGNLFVALAKREVFGEVDIDSIAGPSEVVVIVDETTRADWTARDLLAQAEHAPGSSVLIGWDEAILHQAVEAVETALETVSRGELARQSLEEFGAVVLTKDAEEACQLANEIAPEHLHIATADAERLAEKIPCAGAVFLGNYTPVAVGDYAAGPSHVLPTGGTARFASGLTVNDFIRTNSLLHFNRDGLLRMVDDIDRLASVEGLTAHRESVDIRLK